MSDPVARLEAWCDNLPPQVDDGGRASEGRDVIALRKIIARYLGTAEQWQLDHRADSEKPVEIWGQMTARLEDITILADALNPDSTKQNYPTNKEN